VSVANELWQVLVPTVSNTGKPFRTRFHRVFDAKVRSITGGLTVHVKTVKGEWVSPDGRVFVEQMIPVSFTATEAQAVEIGGIVKKMYEQEAVFVYRLSDRVILV
jgi:hypothetical protein